MIRLGYMAEGGHGVLGEVEKGEDRDGLTKSSCRTYFVVSSVEVAHLSLPIFLLAFVACDGRETVECAWGRGSS